jgi:hypothetical protein
MNEEEEKIKTFIAELVKLHRPVGAEFLRREKHPSIAFLTWDHPSSRPISETGNGTGTSGIDIAGSDIRKKTNDEGKGK